MRDPVNAAFVMMLVMLAGCGTKKDGSQQESSGAGSSVNSVPVQIAVAERKHLSVTKTYSGTLEGEEQANIVAKIPERITGINVHVGSPVSAGQVTIALDKSGTTSQFYQAEAGYRNAEKTFQRMKSLYEEGAISLQSLDGAQTAYDVARANFEAARSAVELTTPIAGLVTAVNVNTGDLTIPGAVLVTIAKVNRMKVIFNINESDVANLAIGHPIQVYSEANPGSKVQGRIVQISKSADIRSRSFEIKALFPNTRDRWYKPGSFCKVSLELSPAGQALLIPTAAIQSDGTNNRVFLVRNGRAFQRVVQVGVADENFTEVLRGLVERDTVATVGMNNVKDSSEVVVVSPARSSGGPDSD